MVHRIVSYAAYAIVGVGSGYALHSKLRWNTGAHPSNAVDLADNVPSRSHQLSNLRKTSPLKPYDILIIGGGATGSGCAVDAATRGFRTALVERDDFGSQTSSRSTKLVHGGVRYLEKAVFNLDISQFKLVLEALKERKILLDNAPHLAKPLPILTVLYFDGQFDDARLNVALACTAAAAGATVVNHVECKQLIKNPDGKIVGALCEDKLSGEKVEVFATTVINATGPFTDNVRRLSEPDRKAMITPSAGAHITLPEFYCPGGIGMIVPKTKDGRVCFMLPWQGAVIAGTTDVATRVTDKPHATDEEVSFILDTISDYLSIKVRRQDVLSQWSGLRPLAADPSARDTSNIVRDHVVVEEADGLISIAGGKWTTYRKMAEDAIDAAVATGRLPQAKRPCVTSDLRLLGAQRYHPSLYAELAQSCGPHEHAIPQLSTRDAQHLAGAYGDRAAKVLQLAVQMDLAQPLAPGHPMLEAEVVYCTRSEYCETLEDFVARRCRLAFTDARAAVAVLPRVAELMAAELGWGPQRQQDEVAAATQYLQTCFGAPGKGAADPPAPEG